MGLEELLYFIRSPGELIMGFFSSSGTWIKIKTKLIKFNQISMLMRKFPSFCKLNMSSIHFFIMSALFWTYFPHVKSYPFNQGDLSSLVCSNRGHWFGLWMVILGLLSAAWKILSKYGTTSQVPSFHGTSKAHPFSYNLVNHKFLYSFYFFLSPHATFVLAIY